MERVAAQKTFDLGGGWWFNINEDGGATVRSPDRGQRINLPPESLKTLREICKEA